MIPTVGIFKRELVYNLDEDTTVWKKAITPVDHTFQPLSGYCMYFSEGLHFHFNEVIVKLTIPKNAKVLISNYKCRASYARVDGVYPIAPCEPPEPLDIKNAYSYFTYPYAFLYQVGKPVYPDSFDLDSDKKICSSGIHFFRTYVEAAEYDFS